MTEEHCLLKHLELIPDDVNIEVIMPISINKYHGFITSYSYNTKYRADFGRGKTRKSKYCNNYEEAFQAIKNFNNMENNSKVKNIIYRIDNQYKCSLLNNKTFLFDFDDIEIVQSYLWHIASGYVVTHRKDKKDLPFHLAVMGKCPESTEIDHINRNKLDNRKCNLRFVSRRTNMINRNKRKSNTSGTPGVCFIKKEQRWCATWTTIEGKNALKGFPFSIHGIEAKERAILYREKMISTLPHYKEALFT